MNVAIMCIATKRNWAFISDGLPTVSCRSWVLESSGRSRVGVWGPHGERGTRTHKGVLGQSPRRSSGQSPRLAESFYEFAQLAGVDQFGLKYVYCRTKNCQTFGRSACLLAPRVRQWSSILSEFVFNRKRTLQ